MPYRTSSMPQCTSLMLQGIVDVQWGIDEVDCGRFDAL
jgi:hypothetical protein